MAPGALDREPLARAAQLLVGREPRGLLEVHVRPGPHALESKLLRVLEDRVISRLGEHAWRRHWLERLALQAALRRADGNAAEAARLLGEVGRGAAKDPGGTVRTMMKRLGVSPRGGA
ncbi:hypothetical protein [Corallococcus sp. 4LFB]|uniref:hypothetical protein n=1 Tax=Corallococcus sp. 4LFB TaxID=3383249 RepID=UPI0039751414